MSTLLAVDTSSRQRALCVLASGEGALLAERRLEGRQLDRSLPGALAALLAAAAPDAVAVVMGPGSYTGLRVGIAAALGLAHARDLPLFGVDALAVVAHAAPAADAAVEAVADAGRGALYVATYRRAAAGLTPTGTAQRVEHAAWRPRPDHRAVSFDAVDGATESAGRAGAALAAAAAVALRGAPLPRAGLEPIYLGGDASAAPGPRV